MKKYLILCTTILSALVLWSCAREEFSAPDSGFADGQTGLVMKVRSTAPQTRLLDPVTDEALNEYRLEQFYYFIYSVDPAQTANAAATPVHVGKWTAPAGTVVTDMGTVEKIPLDEYTALKVDDDTYSGYVYVIANYKVAETLQAWDAAIEGKNYSTMTWDYFQQLPLPASFDVYRTDTGDEIMNQKEDQGHRFKAQDSFIMASDPTPFTVTKGEVKPINALLKRLAVKISLEINLAKWYVQKNNGVYKYTWYSDPARIQVYMNYAAKVGTMDGKALTYTEGADGNASDFFTYRRFAFIPNWTKKTVDDTGIAHYTFPDGSFPVKEPYHWIYDTEKASQTQPVDGQYYTADEDQQGKVVEINGEIQYSTFTRQAYKIDGTPFYSYPYDYSKNSAYAPFFKVIVEWTAKIENDNPATGSKRATDTEPGVGGTNEIIGREFFYKITMPDKDKEKNDIPRILNANQWYKVTLNLSVLGSEADETAIDISGDQGYYVVNWSDPTSPETPDLNAGRYLSVPSLNHDDAGHPVYYMYSNKLEIPVSTSHNVTISDVTTSYEIFDPTIRTNTDVAAEIRNHIRSTSPFTGFLDKNDTQSTGYNFTLAYDENKHLVELKHSPETTLGSLHPKDVSKITYTFKVTHHDDSNYTETITVIQYPSIYAEGIANTDNGERFYSSYYGYMLSGNVFINNARYARPSNMSSSDRWRVVVGLDSDDIGSSTGNNNPNKYKITSSVLDPSLGFVLGDPRTDGIDNLNYSFASGPSIEGGSRSLTYYYPTEHKSGSESSSRTYNMVAPSFINASSFGKCGPAMSYDEAVRRCAAYQEDGYPAGRWRLPTRAELQFIATLSANKLIPQLYNDAADQGVSSIYWSAHGLKTIRDGVVYDNTDSDTGWVRCVYDDWYWGSERAVDTKTFTWGDQPRQ